jgi:hypothetical protein
VIPERNCFAAILHGLHLHALAVAARLGAWLRLAHDRLASLG